MTGYVKFFGGKHINRVQVRNYSYICWLKKTRQMKKLILTIYLLCGIVIGMEAAKKPQLAPSYAWKASNPLGLRLESTIDTLFENYCRRSIPSAVSDEWASTGNLGAEGMNMIWSDRQSMSDFYFRDALSAW